MGPRPLSIASAAVAGLACIFLIVGVASTEKGWFKNSMTLSHATLEIKWGTRGFCASSPQAPISISVCTTYSDIVDQYEKNPNVQNEDAIAPMKKIAHGGLASLVLGVFAFLTTLAAIAWVLLRAFDVHDTCKKYLPGFIILIVSTVLALLAAVVFIAVIKKVEADNPNDVSTSQTTLELEVEKLKPDYAWYLVLLAVVFNIIAAVLLFLDRKESAYQNMGDRTSLNGDTYQ